MVSGHLRERDGIYYMVLSYTGEDGKRRTPCWSTHLPVKGNKKRAETMLDQLRRDTEETLRCQKLAGTAGAWRRSPSSSHDGRTRLWRNGLRCNNCLALHGCTVDASPKKRQNQ